MLKCGILLKKASNNVFRIWREKYVVVTIGKLLWFPLPSGHLQDCEVLITDKMRKHQREMSTCRLRVIPSSQREHGAALQSQQQSVGEPRVRRHLQQGAGGPSRPDVGGRAAQLHPVDLVLRAPLQPPSAPSGEREDHREALPLQQRRGARQLAASAAAGAVGLGSGVYRRLGRYNDPSMWFSQHIFTAVRDLANRATTEEEVVLILGTITNIPLRIPVFFIQSISQGRRGPTNDPQLTQVIRDLNRETVLLNDQPFQATLGDSDTDGFASKVLFLLVESIRRREPSMPVWDALRFARKVLLHTYRSQTGGDCFDALNEMLGQSSLVAITPVPVGASKNPIRIDVTNTIPNVNDVCACWRDER